MNCFKCGQLLDPNRTISNGYEATMTHQEDGCIRALKEKLISAERIINGLIACYDAYNAALKGTAVYECQKPNVIFETVMMMRIRLRDFEALKLLLEENSPSGSFVVAACDWEIDQRKKIKKLLTEIGERPTCF